MVVSLGDWTFQDNVVVSSSTSEWPFLMDILTLEEEMTRLYQNIQSPSDAAPHCRRMDASYHKVIGSSVVTDFTYAVFASLLASAHALPFVSNQNTSSLLSIQTKLFTVSTGRLETLGQVLNDWYVLCYLEQFVFTVSGF